MTTLDDLSPLFKQILAIQPAGIELFLVGGAVRDILLGHATHDLDFALARGAIPAARRVADALGGSFYPLDVQRDTGRAILRQGDNDLLVLDFATLRGPNLEADLLDRDFTINAIAINLHSIDELIDPLNGIRDLRAKVIRACSPVSFETDPLRILRAVRLAAQLGFRIEGETLTLLRAAVNRLNETSAERLRDEFFKLLEGPHPAAALRALEMLGATGGWLPEAGLLKGVARPPNIPDRWEYALAIINRLTGLRHVLKPDHDPQEAANWAMGLVSVRIGRYRRQIQEHLSNALNPNRSPVGLLMLAALQSEAAADAPRPVENVRRRGEFLRLSNVEIDRLETILQHRRRLQNLPSGDAPPSEREIYRFFRDTGAAGVDLCLLVLAETLAEYGAALPEALWAKRLETVRTLLEAWWERRDQVIAPPVLLNGNDLLKILQLKPGPLVGDILEQIREAQAAGEVGTRAEALELAMRMIEK